MQMLTEGADGALVVVTAAKTPGADARINATHIIIDINLLINALSFSRKPSAGLCQMQNQSALALCVLVLAGEECFLDDLRAGSRNHAVIVVLFELIERDVK